MKTTAGTIPARRIRGVKQQFRCNSSAGTELLRFVFFITCNGFYQKARE